MIEKTVIKYLGKSLKVPVYMEVPENAPDTFVVAEKTSSARENHISTAMFALQSYGKTLLAAAELNEEVKKAMDNIITLDEISGSNLNSDYNYTDTETKKYRYQAVYDIYFYE